MEEILLKILTTTPLKDKNRLERKCERFSYIRNHEIRDNILKSKKGERCWSRWG